MNPRKELSLLCKKTFGEQPKRIVPLTPHASNRQYFKLFLKEKTFIGTVDPDPRQTSVFVMLAKHLKNQNISVPHLYAVNTSYTCYIQEDCGNLDLYAFLLRATGKQKVAILYKTIDLLLTYQKNAKNNWDYKNCYPFSSFDTKEIKRDFDRLTQKTLIPLNIPFNGIKKDLDKLIKEIIKIPKRKYTMMHRDFQPRNILVQNDTFILIDFQNCRKGPFYYDLASLLFHSHSRHLKHLREPLINYYVTQSGIVDRELFLKEFYLISIVRIVQSLGSYGIAGIQQEKKHFKEAIPFAFQDLSEVLLYLKKYNLNFTTLHQISQYSCRF